jgi:intracellular multiplication protein IcmD
MKSPKFIKFFIILAAVVSLFVLETASAGTSGIALSTITTHVNKSVSEMAKILADVAVVAGVAFILAAFFKFHQHKLNPQQVPISQGVTLLLIGAGLTLFVVMLPTAKRAIFGSAEMTKIGGSQLKNVIGGS